MPRSTTTRCHSGFTLIELLVVISIISVMLAFLLPSLATARDTAKALQCMSNQRQLYPGFQTYVLDHKGWWVVAGYNANVVWPRIVTKNLDIPYMGEQSVNINLQLPWNPVTSDQGYGAPLYTQNYYSTNRKNLLVRCPVDNFTNAWGGQNATSYGFNSGTENGWGMGYSDLYTTSPTSNYAAKWGRVRDYKIYKMSEVTVIADYVYANGFYDYIAGSLGTLAVAQNGAVHNGGSNMLIADGHAVRLLRTAITINALRRE